MSTSRDKACLSSVEGLGDEERVFDTAREWKSHDENERNEKRWEDFFFFEGDVEGDVGRDTDCERRVKLKICEAGDVVWGMRSGDMAAQENKKPDVKNSE